jgi:hypothetical protein
VQAGLRFRPLVATVRETYEWQCSRPAPEQEKLEAGLSAEQEAALLTSWQTKNGAPS